ncbi:MAG: hypothetical protein GX458_03450 [Phyllobacteriaceae bacterium]|nr:hypothetical protein [Phyllobacteriaceae bacterium]
MTTAVVLFFALLPWIVVLLVIGLAVGGILSLTRSTVGRVLGRSGPSPDRSGAPAAIGRTGAFAFGPVETLFRGLAKAFVVVAGVALAAEIGVWNDGLVDAPARVVGFRTLCLASFGETAPHSIAEYLQTTRPTECPTTKDWRAVRVDGVELAVSDGAGGSRTTFATRSQFGEVKLAPGDEVTVTHVLGDPTALARHPAQVIAIGPVASLVVAFVATLLAEGIRRLRVRLGGPEAVAGDRAEGRRRTSLGGRLKRLGELGGGELDVRSFGRQVERWIAARSTVGSAPPRPSSAEPLDPERIARVLRRPIAASGADDAGRPAG